MINYVLIMKSLYNNIFKKNNDTHAAEGIRSDQAASDLRGVVPCSRGFGRDASWATVVALEQCVRRYFPYHFLIKGTFCACRDFGCRRKWNPLHIHIALWAGEFQEYIKFLIKLKKWVSEESNFTKKYTYISRKLDFWNTITLFNSQKKPSKKASHLCRKLLKPSREMVRASLLGHEPTLADAYADIWAQKKPRIIGELSLPLHPPPCLDGLSPPSRAVMSWDRQKKYIFSL